MTWRAPAALVCLGALLLAPAPAHAVGGDRVLTLQDPAITESSGLVDLGPTMVTTNDSGSTARLYVIGPDGRTVGTTDFSAPTVDVEALAPAGRSVVWVGDIGDNSGDRRSVQVYRVPVGTGARQVRAASYDLVYPQGHPDAESLFLDQDGRLNVVTKSFQGGTVYRAPASLRTDRPNRLVAVGQVAEFATDAAVLRDGRHLLVRGYGQVGVYALPSLRRVGGFDLPPQPQGEGISVGPGGRVRVSSEGAGTPILQVAIPASLQRQLRAASSPGTSQAPASTQSSAHPGSSARSGRDHVWVWWAVPAVVGAGALAAVLLVAVLLVRARRRRRT